MFTGADRGLGQVLFDNIHITYRTEPASYVTTGRVRVGVGPDPNGRNV